MEPSDGSLTIGPPAAPVRRELGPLSWFIFEELVLCAEPGGGGEPRAVVGVRGLAAALGISKDTAARGLSRLIDVGLARRVVTRTDEGRFASSYYLLRIPPGVSVTDSRMRRRATRSAATSRSRRTRVGVTRRDRPGSQLTLIDQAGG